MCTDFSSDGAWDSLRASLFVPDNDGFLANVAVVDDQRYEALASDRVLDLIPPECQHPPLVLEDSVALASTERPLLVLDGSMPAVVENPLLTRPPSPHRSRPTGARSPIVAGAAGSPSGWSSRGHSISRASGHVHVGYAMRGTAVVAV
ncbi:DUF6924 domain-containing protein [Streptomyces sp. NPDC060235]|uniref:DUF6924 domain-containing protein n=1 Tax=Streptomyces sp. NPDC060235 TaxID=3347080 RepID=UPI003653C838